MITGKYPNLRLRRNRKESWTRRLVQENTLSPNDFILPIFLIDGSNKKESISTMPGVFRYTINRVSQIVDKAIKNKSKIMGFGHREYKVKDPRAIILQKLAEELFIRFGADEMYEVAKSLEAEAIPRLGPKGIFPNVDFYSGLVNRKLGIPRDLFTPIFAISRVAVG